MMKSKDKGGDAIIVWLREDLRLDDNPALAHAAETGRPVVPVFILDEETDGLRPLGGAARWWLHHSLVALAESLAAAGSRLILRRGGSARELADIANACGATTLFFNRRYGHAERALDDSLTGALPGIEIERFTANILHDPERVATKGGNYYRVYTPFRKNLVERGEPRDPIDPPSRLVAPKPVPPSDDLANWALLPTRPDWAEGIAAAWTPGEPSAHARLERFCEEILGGYRLGREQPSQDRTTRLSPHLRWGEISPYRLWHEAHARAAQDPAAAGENIETLRRELIWRDFNYHLLFHAEALGAKNFNQRFDRLEWRRSTGDLAAWQKGRTGYPIVDAGMRQLWQTGWMHNRVRMIVGSFLTRDLLIDWREGEAWFWDTLVDADPASNAAQWQWIAGTGPDAQPFFRIFNPITQSEKFDAEGDYIRRFLPELQELPTKALHAPWTAGESVLRAAGVELGRTYPRPIVDHGEARRRALDAYARARD